MRRTAVGFNPAVWRSRHADANDAVDPLAAFIESGAAGRHGLVAPALYGHRTIGRPAAAAARNAHRFDLLVTTDSPAKAAILKTALRTFDLGRIQVQVADTESAGMVEWLSAEMRHGAWSAHDVIGHIHDGDGDTAAIDFRCTELLGGVRPMIDPILEAFAAQPTLGLVFPCDPWLPGSRPVADYPSGGMFWARRATLEQPASIPESLPGVCIAAGLTQAVPHVAGVFR